LRDARKPGGGVHAVTLSLLASMMLADLSLKGEVKMVRVSAVAAGPIHPY
jgi:hypothetical protein